MKKIIYTIILSLFSVFLYAQNYIISDVHYDITGCGLAILGTTKPYAVEQNIDFDSSKKFNSIDELNKEIIFIKDQLVNLRAFESIDITYDINEVPIINENNEEIYQVSVTISLKDSLHLLGVPYGKYNSNTGTEFKLKLKDSNFLGTLNPLNSELNFSLKQENENDSVDFSLGGVFSYDYPFKAGIFNATWVNSDSISYTFGNNIPEWNAKTGLKLTLPKNSINYQLEFYQYSINNLDYISYGDNIYFTEEAIFSTPITLYRINNWGRIIYTPSVSVTYNWDKDGISNLAYNYWLDGPKLNFKNNISTSKINWNSNLRKGISGDITSNFIYNCGRNLWYPYLSVETKAFYSFNFYDGNWFNKAGINLDAYYFTYFHDFNNSDIANEGELIGGRLRGIRDNQVFAGTDSKACREVSAIIVNFDLPFSIITTNFSNKYLKYFNFEMQFSPFVDICLNYNKFTKEWFNPKDGFYTAGLEVLVYPKKWSNYTIRGSLGVDVGRKFFASKLNMDWRENVSPYEISIGLGLLY